MDAEVAEASGVAAVGVASAEGEEDVVVAVSKRATPVNLASAQKYRSLLKGCRLTPKSPNSSTTSLQPDKLNPID